MQGYREILQFEFKKRVAKNKSYTLRAFASLLEMNSGSLSSIFKGKRSLPRSHWQLCCTKLNLSLKQKEIFISSLVQEFKLHNFSFLEDNSPKKNILTVANSQLNILSTWEHAAVLCLMDLKEFEFSVSSIQQYLEITSARAEEVFNQLLVTQLVQFKNGRWIKSFENFNTSEDIQSKALALGHQNELQLAQKKMAALSVQDREFSSLTFAGSSKKMRRMKLWLRKMADEFDKKFEKKDGDQVFLFSLQLYPVSKKVK